MEIDDKVHPMNFFLDCEFNGWGDHSTGELISMALVSADGRYEFYEVLGCDNPHPFVAVHVMPVLNKEKLTLDVFARKLAQFLHDINDKEKEIIIIADYPSDVELFNRALIRGPGKCLRVPKIQFILDLSLSTSQSKIPHNALEDARALALDFEVKSKKADL